MRIKKFVLALCLFLWFSAFCFSQTHTSVPVDNHIYYFLEQAELRGLCSPLPGTKPYTQNTIILIINEILSNENNRFLNDIEKSVFNDYLDQFSNQKIGLDFQRGSYHNEAFIGNTGIPLTFNVGANLHAEGSAGFYDSFTENYYGMETWVGLSFNGDIGGSVSWAINGAGGLMNVPRKKLGEYNIYYEGFDNLKDPQFQNNLITVYSEPLTHFLYTYKKRWDASVHHLSALTSFNSWADTISVGYNFLPELTASFLENKLILRAGRLNHEWGSTSFGSSLALNQMSRPFMAMEASFNLFSWFSFSSMTGFLEFFNRESEKISGMTFQNMYSITMLQFNFKNYLFLDIGETVVYPKRFEFGYIFPLMSNLIYKSFIGDFDNLAVFVNIKAQYPGIGNIWFSFFGDEARFSSQMNELDRTMIAWQAGAEFTLPVLSFSSLKLSYTKINPYCYTHNRNFNPWYNGFDLQGNRLRMETSYTNNGVGLGYYLPPNADEILVRFNTMPLKNLTAGLQFQLIRHGADFGDSAVDGSNLLSELDPYGRDDKLVLKRFFLRDGAYQWFYIFKLNAEWKIPNLPVTLFGEAGINFSYFTDINETANITGKAHSYSVVNTDEYPKTTGFIFKIGVRVFAR